MKNIIREYISSEKDYKRYRLNRTVKEIMLDKEHWEGEYTGMREMDKLALVDNISEVLENIKTFNEELPKSVHLIKKLTSFKHWYYSSELDLFGPSKFIGYKKNTAIEYEKGTAINDWYMDGRDTEPIIKQWSVETNGADYEELKGKLSMILSEYDKNIRSNSHIHMLSR